MQIEKSKECHIHDVVDYSMLISCSTTAPSEWRYWKKASDGRILQPFPFPHEEILHQLKEGTYVPLSCPSMTNVSWLHDKKSPDLDHSHKISTKQVKREHSGEVTSLVQVGVGGDKRPKSDGVRVVAGLDDDEPE